MCIKVRFAPSPTGNLHIGSARTALFNYLFARRHGGQFVLRVEDTDQERSRQEFTDDILAGLGWLGLQSGEPPIYQNSRRSLHLEYVDKLLREGRAYEQDGAVYFKIPTEGETVIEDLVKGRIVFQNKDFKNQVIRKSDGSATYNFAVVLDDALMGITHIIRGEDHISNTPKQIFLYAALGFALPRFAHIPMILGQDRAKLSKRHGATSINEYRREGFLPEAIVNYLALLGWTPADGTELMSLDELGQKFDLDRVSKSNSIFDLGKLRWLNAQKLKNYTAENLKKLYPDLDIEILRVIKDDMVLLADVPELAKVFTAEEIVYAPEQIEELKTPSARQVLLEINEKIDGIYNGTIQEQYGKAQDLLNDVVQCTGLKRGAVFHPLRLALTACQSGPGLKFLLTLLGREKVKERLGNALRS
ncbi:glutamyl-tRNA synthetases [Candidatus Termititenax persephonae]|uniref:Glutamate--tRNA ligase n=1 Tax=Candidatus Termititenax persephonae TaxID=2218525 RepID=A0A388TGV2_9BACT|nr:glutamyl-tRNA synthetases [Candidatus Termititenax persephonae]